MQDREKKGLGEEGSSVAEEAGGVEGAGATVSARQVGHPAPRPPVGDGGADMRHVFGPVLSRRLGRSLGIDPVPLKTCNFSCVYCQLGRTRRLSRKRRAFFSMSRILAEVAATLSHHGEGAIDWMTFVGSGETTLYSRLGTLIRFVKSMSRLPVAVITNGSLLSRAEVRDELMAADAVLSGLDAGSEALYCAINRPHADFPFDRHVDGLMEFRKDYGGHLLVEVMLVAGINDTPDALRDLSLLLDRVEPDAVHIATPTRPPAESWVNQPSPESLERASSLLGGGTRILRSLETDLISGSDEEIEDAVINIVSRHPMQEAEIVRTLARWSPGQVVKTLDTLSDAGRICVVERLGRRFWCAVEIMVPDFGSSTTSARMRR